MCGRYALYGIDEMGDRFEVDTPEGLRPNYNVAPTQYMPVIRNIDGNRKVELMYWGIPRMLGKDLVKEIINTRADKASSPFWKKQVTQQRVLVPANGFYEWKKTSDGKTPYFIGLESNELYAFAGIWNSWKDKDGNEFNAYSIMTTDPNSEMKLIHNRMPVILPKGDEKSWLDSNLSESGIHELLITPEDDYLSIYEVGKDVGNVRNNDEQLIQPVR